MQTKFMDHSRYQMICKTKTVEELKFIIQDCREALKAFPENPNAGYYEDEVHYCAAELRRREKFIIKKKGK